MIYTKVYEDAKATKVNAEKAIADFRNLTLPNLIKNWRNAQSARKEYLEAVEKERQEAKKPATKHGPTKSSVLGNTYRAKTIKAIAYTHDNMRPLSAMNEKLTVALCGDTWKPGLMNSAPSMTDDPNWDHIANKRIPLIESIQALQQNIQPINRVFRNVYYLEQKDASFRKNERASISVATSVDDLIAEIITDLDKFQEVA